MRFNLEQPKKTVFSSVDLRNKVATLESSAVLARQEKIMQQEVINEFRGQLRGQLIEPTDVSYEKERKVYNAMIDRKAADDRQMRRCGRCDDRNQVCA